MIVKRKRPQEEIFASYSWWDKGCFLGQMTGDRCDYIEACIARVFGQGAIAQQEILEIGSGGGLICEDLARRGAIMIGIDPSPGALEAARIHARQSGLGHIIYYEQGVAEALPYANGSFQSLFVWMCLNMCAICPRQSMRSPASSRQEAFLSSIRSTAQYLRASHSSGTASIFPVAA